MVACKVVDWQKMQVMSGVETTSKFQVVWIILYICMSKNNQQDLETSAKQTGTVAKAIVNNYLCIFLNQLVTRCSTFKLKNYWHHFV